MPPHVKSTHLTGGETKTRKSDLPVVPELARNRELDQFLCLSHCAFPLHFAASHFPKEQLKMETKAQSSMTQCDFNGNLILEQKKKKDFAKCSKRSPIPLIPICTPITAPYPIATEQAHVGRSMCCFFLILCSH